MTSAQQIDKFLFKSLFTKFGVTVKPLKSIKVVLNFLWQNFGQ